MSTCPSAPCKSSGSPALASSQATLFPSLGSSHTGVLAVPWGHQTTSISWPWHMLFLPTNSHDISSDFPKLAVYHHLGPSFKSAASENVPDHHLNFPYPLPLHFSSLLPPFPAPITTHSDVACLFDTASPPSRPHAPLPVLFMLYCSTQVRTQLKVC